MSARNDRDRALAELTAREARIQRLIELLERLQVTYDKESAHWLTQIDEQRQALSAARERARLLELINQHQPLAAALEKRLAALESTKNVY